MPAITFHAVPTTVDSWIIIQLPEAASSQLPSRGQVAIVGSINGAKLQLVLEPDGNWGHWFKLPETLRKTAKILPGVEVEVIVTPTKTWPEPSLPADLQTALDTAQDIQPLWQAITPMARWEWVRWVNETKNPTTRARRVEVSISKMRSGKRRPCCFNLSACTDPDLAKRGRLKTLV